MQGFVWPLSIAHDIIIKVVVLAVGGAVDLTLTCGMLELGTALPLRHIDTIFIVNSYRSGARVKVNDVVCPEYQHDNDIVIVF